MLSYQVFIYEYTPESPFEMMSAPMEMILAPMEMVFDRGERPSDHAFLTLGEAFTHLQ